MEKQTTSDVSRPLEPTSVHERQELAYEMRLNGRPLPEIAELLSYDDVPALIADLGKRYAWESEFITSQGRESLLILQIGRLEKLLAGSMPSAVMGDPQSTDKALKIIQEISKLTNLYVPDSQGGQQTVLVVGGMEKDYVSKLKELVDGD